MAKNTVKMSCLVIGLALAAASSFADDGKGKPKPIPAPGTGTVNAQQIKDFETFKAACADPRSFGQQNQPDSLHVSCTQVRYYWVTQGSHKNLAQTEQYTAEVKFGKEALSPFASAVVKAAEPVSCVTFKRVKETYLAPEALVTCDEILGAKTPKTLDQICRESVGHGKGKGGKGKGQTPTTIEDDLTTKSINTCEVIPAEHGFAAQ